jgi:hypothetical protein
LCNTSFLRIFWKAGRLRRKNIYYFSFFSIFYLSLYTPRFPYILILISIFVFLIQCRRFSLPAFQSSLPNSDFRLEGWKAEEILTIFFPKNDVFNLWKAVSSAFQLL